MGDGSSVTFDLSALVTTAPTVEPLSLAEAKLHLHVDHTDEDSYISDLILAARRYAEIFTRRQFIQTTSTLYMNRFPDGRIAIDVPAPPLVSIQSINYIAPDGTTTLLATSAYTVDVNTLLGRIYPVFGGVWPVTRDIENAVIIALTHGYGTAGSNVPADIRAGMRLHLGHLYRNRESVITGTIVSEVPQSVQDLLWPNRVWLPVSRREAA